MNICVDTSVIIAVITGEKHKQRLIEMTRKADLIAPASLHWEIGNAFSAMFKRRCSTLEQAMMALETYAQIPLRFCDVDLRTALELADRLNLYAYDAYVITCAQEHKSPLLSLDDNLTKAAVKAGARVLEVST